MTFLGSISNVLLDAYSIGLILATMVEWLPPVAALFSIIWVGIRIYETKTVQCWINCYKYGGKCKSCDVTDNT